MIKKLLTFLCVFSVLIFSFALCAGAVYTPYAGVTDTTSPVKVLTDYYINSDDFKSSEDFMVMRTSQTEYYLFYGDLNTTSVKYLRYYYQYQQQSDYKIEAGELTDFTYQLNGYTVVGTIPGTLQSASFTTSNNSRNSFVLLCIITVFTIISTVRSFIAGRFS